MGAPPRITKTAVNKVTNNFAGDINRARALYEKIVDHRYTSNNAATCDLLRTADKRDITQFIFFEIAAKFENYAMEMFQVKAQSRLRSIKTRSAYVMDDLDNGLGSKLGWGSPEKLKDRGKHLFGENSFFGDLVNKLGKPTYDTLINAHTARNRIAHHGGNAQSKFVKLLESNGIAKNERQGLSVGRFLREYSANSSQKNNFYLYLAGYEEFAKKANAELP